MIIYAHRGMHGRGIRENTMLSFEQAQDSGYGIETDLRLDADGEVILFHDRCIKGRRVRDMTRERISKMVGYEVPTLRQFLDRRWTVPINLEIKTTEAFERMMPQLAKSAPTDVLLTSFIHQIASDAAYAGYRSGLLSASSPHRDESMSPVARRLDVMVWSYEAASTEVLARSCAEGFANIVYGPVTKTEHDRLRRCAVDAVITDHPHLGAQ